MPNLIKEKHKSFTKVFVNYHDWLGAKVYVGELRDSVLKIYDKDNYHKDSEGLGVDSIVITAPEIQYEMLKFTLGGNDYFTTRWYFYGHAKRYNLFNGRNQLFLPKNHFGINRAIKWEQFITYKELSQLNLFDTYEGEQLTPNSSSGLFMRWKRAMDLAEEVENHTIKRIEI